MEQINYEITSKVIELFIKETFEKNGFEKAIIGVSGGIDSAVVLDLTSRALGPQNILALLMPYRTSSSDSISDGKLICESRNVDYKIIDISPSIDAYFKSQPATDRILLGNKCARERMAVLYDYSARIKALVVGTSNKSELLIGYSTQFGDSAAALLPIGDLYKTEIFGLADFLSIPREILEKKPSADLWKDQTDEREIGVTYSELDQILYDIFEERKSPDDLVKAGYGVEIVKKIVNMVINSHFKRTFPPVTKIHSRTIGMDFRFPRDWYK